MHPVPSSCVVPLRVQQQVQSHKAAARHVHEALQPATEGWFLLSHKHPAAWILMHHRRQAAGWPVVAWNSAEEHTRGALISCFSHAPQIRMMVSTRLLPPCGSGGRGKRPAQPRPPHRGSPITAHSNPVSRGYVHGSVHSFQARMSEPASTGAPPRAWPGLPLPSPSP